MTAVEPLPAITIWQPWCSLIVAGAKPYEFRGWPAPGRLVGRRIALHAGARPARHSEIAELILCLRTDGGCGLALDPAVALPLLDRWHGSPGVLPLSAVLGTATLGTPRLALDLFAGPAGHDPDEIAPDTWAWPLTDIRPCQPPIPARGAQGFWSWHVAKELRQ